MSIFNSLGSNYDFKSVINCLFSQDKIVYSTKLKTFLEEKYKGQTMLTYKGREALTLALSILNLPKGSFVAINPFTCHAVYKAVDQAHYYTQLIDLEDKDLNFSPKSLLQSLNQNPKIKVVVIQNTLGYPCDIGKIEEICKDKKLILIEDLAHSVGAMYPDGRETGTVGDFITLSFSQDKMIDAVSGGALIIRNKQFNDTAIKQFENINHKQQLSDRLYPLLTFKIRKTYDFGLGKPIHFFLKVFNLLSKPDVNKFYETYFLPNWYCNLALRSFKKLPEDLTHRKIIANVYKNSIDKKVLWKSVTENISYSSNLRFPIFTENRNNLVEYLKKNGIYVSDIWYSSVSKDCRNSQFVSRKILNLPTHKNVSEKDALYISEKINEWLKLK